MAKEKATNQDIIRLANPIFIEIDCFELRLNELSQRIISNKFIYLISSFNKYNKIDKCTLRFARHDGILCILPQITHPAGVLPGEYYIYVSGSELENYKEKIIKHICNGPITIEINTDSILIPGSTPTISPSTLVSIPRLYYGNYNIGCYTNTKIDMKVRRYGHGKDNFHAIFLIGRIHGDEHGAQDSIEIMENFIKGNPSSVPENTSVYILNPANNSNNRFIRGIDPNRNFRDKDFASIHETGAIALLTKTIAIQWKNFTIISAHQYYDLDNKPELIGINYVFPLYDLTDAGFKKLVDAEKDKEKKKEKLVELEMEKDIHYTNPGPSDALAKNFSNIVKFVHVSMWKFNEDNKTAEMYPGEYLFYVSRLCKKDIRMIEYEIPISNVKNKKIINKVTKEKLVELINSLLEGKI